MITSIQLAIIQAFTALWTIKIEQMVNILKYVKRWRKKLSSSSSSSWAELALFPHNPATHPICGWSSSICGWSSSISGWSSSICGWSFGHQWKFKSQILQDSGHVLVPVGLSLAHPHPNPNPNLTGKSPFKPKWIKTWMQLFLPKPASTFFPNPQASFTWDWHCSAPACQDLMMDLIHTC